MRFFLLVLLSLHYIVKATSKDNIRDLFWHELGFTRIMVSPEATKSTSFLTVHRGEFDQLVYPVRGRTFASLFSKMVIPGGISTHGLTDALRRVLSVAPFHVNDFERDAQRVCL